MDIADRINQIIDHEGLTVASFARKIGIGDQTVRSVCVVKRNKPGYDFLANIVQTFEWLNPAWLLTGRGEMSVTRAANEGFSASDMSQLIAYLREKDEKIEHLIEEKMSWKVRYELMTRK